MVVRPFVLGLALTLAATPGVQAVQQAKSRYTTVDFAKCRSASAKAWQCNGLPGYPLYISVRNLRTFIAIGPAGRSGRAAMQTLDATNTLFDGRTQRSAIEWRFVIRDKKTVPYATIVRYFTRDTGSRGEVVVVSRVTETESCQVARIDALANPEAMVMARTIADRQARNFDCRKEPQIVGAKGKSPM